MIALNRDLPQTCYDCPCFQTFFLNDDIMVRQCGATDIVLYSTSLEKFMNDKEIQNRWFNFTKPVNCPWRKV